MSNNQCDNGKNKSNTAPVCKRPVSSLISTFVFFGFVTLVLLLLALPLLLKYSIPPFEDARSDTTKASIKQLTFAVQTFKLHTGRYPTDSEGLEALVDEPENVENWDPEGYLMTDVVPPDGWKNEFIYKLTPQSINGFVIISLGKNGKEGGKGDRMDITSDDYSKPDTVE